MKMCYIIIPKDTNEENASKDQFHYYQLDGETIAVAVGVKQLVPLWVGKRAKEIGEVADYIEVDVDNAA